MTLKELISFMEEGREIEFCFENNDYFLEPFYENQCFNGKYSVYDNTNKKYIIIGRWDDIISYKFQGKTSIKENIRLFCFNYIL